MKTVFFSLLLSGCAGSFEVLDRASVIVWQSYKVKDCAPPKADWEIPSLCAGGWLKDGRCVEESYKIDEDKVVFVADARPLHSTAFAHGLLHAAIVCDGQKDGDPQHRRVEWTSKLDNANHELFGKGL